MSSKLLTGEVQENDHFNNNFSNGLYIGIPLEVACECEFEAKYPLVARVLIEGTSDYRDSR